MSTTRAYETLVILKATGTEQEVARETAQLEEPIKKVGGRVESTQTLGRRKLAFRIARYTEGSYCLLRFHAPTEQVKELERLFRLNEAVLRFIILTAEEVPVAPAPTRQAAPQVSGAPPRA